MRRRGGGGGGVLTGGLRCKNNHLRRRHQVSTATRIYGVACAGYPRGRVIGSLPCLIFYTFISPGLLAQKKKYAIT